MNTYRLRAENDVLRFKGPPVRRRRPPALETAGLMMTMRNLEDPCKGWPIKLAYPHPKRDEWVTPRKHVAPPGKLRGDVRST